MKEKMWKGKKLKKLISFLISFAIIMTSLWINPIPIMALNAVDESCTVSNPIFWDDGSLKSLTVSFQATGNYADAYGKIGIHKEIAKRSGTLQHIRIIMEINRGRS